MFKPQSILIVGGGTAGWMTANSLLHAWPDVKISLIESEDIGVIGVGEGATPYLKQYFRQLNIPESEWMPACDATYKLGISFEGWSGKTNAESYFHPFFSTLDKPSAELFFHNCGLRRRGFEAAAHPDDYFVATELVRQSIAPTSTQHSDIDIDYAYHFDSVKLGHFLRTRAKKLGLVHIVDKVSGVETHLNGDISQLLSEKNGHLQADFFIDCTGFSARLIHQALKRDYVNYAENLFNNAAVAIQTPYTVSQSLTQKAQTRSVALSSGWMWNIPLKTRQGNGYVYSNDYISADQAEVELRQKLKLDDNSDVNVRHLKMRVGRLTEHWYKNCLAVGLSQGFIEPLEATALMLTQLSVDKFIASFEQQNASMEATQLAYNHQLNQVFDGIRDYIVAHYKLTNRHDSLYWLDNKNNQQIPPALSAILEAWDKGADVEKILAQHKEYLVYLRPSWYCILSGMDRFPDTLQASKWVADVEEAKQYCRNVAAKYFIK